MSFGDEREFIDFLQEKDKEQREWEEEQARLDSEDAKAIADAEAEDS